MRYIADTLTAEEKLLLSTVIAEGTQYWIGVENTNKDPGYPDRVYSVDAEEDQLFYHYPTSIMYNIKPYQFSSSTFVSQWLPFEQMKSKLVGGWELFVEIKECKKYTEMKQTESYYSRFLYAKIKENKIIDLIEEVPTLPPTNHVNIDWSMIRNSPKFVGDCQSLEALKKAEVEVINRVLKPGDKFRVGLEYYRIENTEPGDTIRIYSNLDHVPGESEMVTEYKEDQDFECKSIYDFLSNDATEEELAYNYLPIMQMKEERYEDFNDEWYLFIEKIVEEGIDEETLIHWDRSEFYYLYMGEDRLIRGFASCIQEVELLEYEYD